MTRTRRAIAVVLCLVALGAAGCGGNGGGSSGSPSPTPTPTSTPRPSSSAKIAIVSPKNGAVVHGTSLQLVVSLQGAHVVKPTTTHIVPTQGHIHVYLDNKIISMNYGLTETVGGLKPGTHVLQAEFVASDHLPWNPRIISAVSFTVKP
jgi:hypothetical protein